MDEQELRLNNDLFFVCSLIEHLGRQTHNRRGDVVDALGIERIAHALEYADVLHSENIDAVADRYVMEAGIGVGTFDNVSEALYGCPTARDMGKVYKRLARGIMKERGLSAADAVAEAFHSPIALLLDDYNGSFFYEAPANVLVAHMTGALE